MCRAGIPSRCHHLNPYAAFYHMMLARIYYHQLETEWIRITIRFFYVAFTLFVICNTLFIQGLMAWQTLTTAAGGA